MKRRSVLAGLGATAAAGAIGMPSIVRAQGTMTLNGAVQFNDDHAFTKALVRFEELVQKCTDEVEAQSKEAGEQAVFDLGLHKVHPELVRALGRLKFRAAAAQNLLAVM